MENESFAIPISYRKSNIKRVARKRCTRMDRFFLNSIFFKGGESDEDPDAVFHFPDLEDYAVDTPFSLLDTFVPVLSQGMAQWWHLFVLAQTLKQYLI